MPIISENSTSATSALIKAFLRMNAMPGARLLAGWGMTVATSPPSNFFDFRPAPHAGRTADQHDNQERECRDVLVLDREICRPQGLDQADQKAAEHRAGQRADAAEHRRCKSLDPGDEAHVEIHQAILQQI